MANRLQLKRGSGAPGSIFYAGEPIYDQSGKVLYVGNSGGTGTGAGSSIASEDSYKTVLEMLYKASASDSGSVRLYEDTDNGTNYVAIAASAALASSYTLRLPDSDGDDGQVLKTDGSGNLAWVNQTSGYTGWSISDGSVTEAILSGNTLNIVSGEGIDAVVSATDTLTISGEDATDTNKGIASFSSQYFTVTSGAVTIKNDTVGVVTAISGTANEVEVSRANGTVTIGLPNDVTISNDLTVNGNLRVVGSAVTFETEVVKVEDRLIELGLVAGATDSSTTWDLGVVFNYGDGTAKKSGIFWMDNQFVGIASAITIADDTGTTDSTPQVTISTYAPLVASDLYLGGFTSGDLVINSANEAVNLIFDGGQYP